MKRQTVFTVIGLILCCHITLGAEINHFMLSSEKIKEAIQYGINTDSKTNEFGGYDLGLNKFSLGDKIGYVDILTPFMGIAVRSRKMKDSGKELSFEEAQELNKRPVQLRVFLYVKKEHLGDPITCVIKTSKELFDISGNVMAFSMCDDKTGDCVRSLAYLLPAREVGTEQSFQILLSGEKFGKKTITINMDQIR